MALAYIGNDVAFFSLSTLCEEKHMGPVPSFTTGQKINLMMYIRRYYVLYTLSVVLYSDKSTQWVFGRHINVRNYQFIDSVMQMISRYQYI